MTDHLWPYFLQSLISEPCKHARAKETQGCATDGVTEDPIYPVGFLLDSFLSWGHLVLVTNKQIFQRYFLEAFTVLYQVRLVDLSLHLPHPAVGVDFEGK